MKVKFIVLWSLFAIVLLMLVLAFLTTTTAYWFYDLLSALVWGLRPRDFSMCHKTGYLCRGEQKWDDNFDQNTPPTQMALLVNMSGPEHPVYHLFEVLKSDNMETNINHIKNSIHSSVTLNIYFLCYLFVAFILMGIDNISFVY